MISAVLPVGSKERAADLRLRRHFHITLDEYNQIVEAQGRACAICGKEWKPGDKRLALDHDHNTGLIRGAICFWCNKLLGMFQDNYVRLAAAAAYLTRPPAVAVLGKRYTLPGRIGTKKRAKMLKSILERDGRFKSYTSPVR